MHHIFYTFLMKLWIEKRNLIFTRITINQPWNCEENHARRKLMLVFCYPQARWRKGWKFGNKVHCVFMYFPLARPLSHHQSQPRTKVRFHFCIHFNMMVRNLLIMCWCQNMRAFKKTEKGPGNIAREKVNCCFTFCSINQYWYLYRVFVMSELSVCFVSQQQGNGKWSSFRLSERGHPW